MHRVLNHRAAGRWLNAMQVRDARKEVGGGQYCRIWTKFMCYSRSPHQSQSHILMSINWIRHIQVKKLHEGGVVGGGRWGGGRGEESTVLHNIHIISFQFHLIGQIWYFLRKRYGGTAKKDLLREHYLYCIDSSRSENNGIHIADCFYNVSSPGCVSIRKCCIASVFIVQNYLISFSQFHICTSGVQSLHCVDVKKQWKCPHGFRTLSRSIFSPSELAILPSDPCDLFSLIPAIFFLWSLRSLWLCSAHSFCFLLFMYFSPSSGCISW